MKTNADGLEGFVKRNLWYIIISVIMSCLAIGGMINTLNCHSKSLAVDEDRFVNLFKTCSELHSTDVRVETKLDGMRNDLTEIKTDMKDVRKFLMDKKIANKENDNGLELNFAKSVIR